MKITNYEIKRDTIIYEVLTNRDNKFTHELPKDLSAQYINKYLEIIERRVDNDEYFESH